MRKLLIFVAAVAVTVKLVDYYLSIMKPDAVDTLEDEMEYLGECHFRPMFLK